MEEVDTGFAERGWICMKNVRIVRNEMYERRLVNACAFCSLAPESKNREDCRYYALHKCRDGWYYAKIGTIKKKKHADRKEVRGCAGEGCTVTESED